MKYGAKGKRYSIVSREMTDKRRRVQIRKFCRAYKKVSPLLCVFLVVIIESLSRLTVGITGIAWTLLAALLYSAVLVNIFSAIKYGFIFNRSSLECKKESPFYFWFTLIYMAFMALAPFVLIAVVISVAKHA